MTAAAAVRVARVNPLAQLALSVILSWGWRRRAVAFGSGAVGALAMPPFSLFPLMVVPMSVAVWLIDGSADGREGRRTIGGLRTAFGAGWWMGFGYFVAGLWWVGAACLVDAEKFMWALPLGVLALPAALAFFPAFGFAFARLLWSPGPRRIFALAFGLGLSEWARGLLLTGFPWNDLGMALGANLMLAQIASVVGLHGLTFLSIAIFAAPATSRPNGERAARRRPTVLAISYVADGGFGFQARRPRVRRFRARRSGSSSRTSPGSGSLRKTRMRSCAVISRCRAEPQAAKALAPERHAFHLAGIGFPFILSRDAEALGAIADFLHEGATLVTGAARSVTKGRGTCVLQFDRST